MTRAFIIVAATLAVPASASADAHETSVHVEIGGGVAQLGDPAGGSEENALTAGGAARFTWATRDWLAYEVTGYGMATGTARHTGLMFEGLDAEIDRYATAMGIEGGANLRWGVSVVPNLTIAVGPQLRVYPTTQALEPGTSAVVGRADAERIWDLAVRGSAGLDLRLSPHWLAGIRVDARRALELGDAGLTTYGATLHLAYVWYPRWWTFEID
jgi:hypothetical protein